MIDDQTLRDAADERFEIEKAIAEFDDKNSGFYAPGIAVMREAARKYAQTLPRYLWRTTGTLPGGQPATVYEEADREKAMAMANEYLRAGIANVSVKRVCP